MFPDRFPRPHWRTALLGSAAMTALMSVPGLGQTAPSATPAIEQITVVAQKREEKAQETPVSMTVISAADLAAISAQKFTDIQHLTPGLQFEGSSNNQYAAEVNIRGQESNQQLLGIDPSVGIYVDGVYQTSTIGMNLADIYGLDHIEVLKGPQGTLYGRNTTGGAINVLTKGPEDTLSGGVQQELGDYGLHITTGYVNVPIAPDKAALRLDAQYGGQDGYAKNLRTGADLGSSETESFRAALRLTPAGNLDIVVRGDYLHSDGGGALFQPIAIVPGSLGAQLIARTAGVPLQQAPQIFTANGGGLTPNLSNKAYDFPERDTFTSSGTSIAATLYLDAITLKSITAYRNFQHDNDEDLDASIFNILSAHNSQAEDQYTEELQASGTALGERLTYVGGIYYYDTSAKDNSASLSLGGTTPTLFRNHLGDESVATYGQTTYAVTSKIHVTGGLRWTTETKDLQTQNSAGTACNIPTVNRIGNSCAAKFSTTDDNTSYSVGLDYTPVDGMLLYFNNSRGFKSGGINERGTVTVGSYAVFAPEVATNYEIGVKSDWLGHRLRINADVYHTDYENIQRSVTIATPSGATASVTSNAAQATIDGAEFETEFVPFENALLSATAAYTDPSYATFIDARGDHTNQRFEGVSRWTYGLSARYTAPLPVGNLVSQVNWFWQSSEDLSPGATGFDPPANHIQAAYGLLDARIAWNLPDAAFEIAIYGKNLTDSRYFTSILDQATNVAARALSTSVGQVGAPRTFGVVVSKKF